MKEKIDDALGIDIDKLIEDSEQDVDTDDEKQVQKYNERREVIHKLKTKLKDARTLTDSKWAEQLLKVSAEKIMEVQEIFRQEIEDCPASKNVTAFGELSNSLTNTVKSVLDIDREQQKIEISREKNILRKREIEIAGGGPILEGEGKTIVGQGSNNDIMKLIKHGVLKDEFEDKKGENDATSETE